MACFKLPKWVICRIDKVRRSFLWGRPEGVGNGISLTNWHSACLPKEWGGMRISQLEARNISLLLRWWWRLYKEPSSLWTDVATKLRWTGTYTNGPFLWSVQGSFFWKNLMNIKHIFQWCTTWTIGDGAMISFWYDAWGGPPLAEAHRPPQPISHSGMWHRSCKP